MVGHQFVLGEVSFQVQCGVGFGVGWNLSWVDFGLGTRFRKKEIIQLEKAACTTQMLHAHVCCCDTIIVTIYMYNDKK